MKAAIHNKYVRTSFANNIFKVIFSFTLVFTLILAAPGGYRNAYAAPLEDCDLDGFDDATGAPVPWPGYDETKGDTPEGPGGGPAPTAAPGNTSNTAPGNSSETPDNTGSTASGGTNGTTSDNANSSTPGNTNGASSGSTNSGASDNKNSTTPGNTNSVTSGSTNNSTPGNTNNSVAGSTNSSTSGNTGGSAPGNTSSTTSDNADNTTPGNTNNAAAGNANDTASDNTNSASADKANNTTSDNTNSTNSQGEVSQSNNEQAAGNSDIGDTENTYISEEELEAIVNTKGSLEITEATGSIIHAGSLLIISGSGFAGNINNLEVEIQSETQHLGTVTSSENGSFETRINIPEDLEAGTHHIIVLYQGNEIIRRQIEVGPKAGDSFIEALSVGFTTDNKGLIPGLSILAGLFVLGIVVLVANALIHSRQNKIQS